MAGPESQSSSTGAAMGQGVRHSGGTCVLILVSFWLDLAHIEDACGRFLV